MASNYKATLDRVSSADIGQTYGKMNRAEQIERYKQARKSPKGPAKRLYSIPEAAFYLGRTVDALREIIWAGKIPYVKDGRRVLIDIRDMDEFIELNKHKFNY